MARKIPQELTAAFAHLEELCVQRKRTELRQGIRELIRRHPSQPRVLNRSLDWLWRSGQLKEGLHFALPRRSGPEASIQNPAKLGVERALYWMTFLNSLSGWPWVARWLPELEARARPSQRHRMMIANLWLAVGRPEKALAAAKEEAAAPSPNPSEERRTALLNLEQHIALRLQNSALGLRSAEKLQRMIPESDRISHWVQGLHRAYFEALAGDAAGALARFRAKDAELPESPIIAPRLYLHTRLCLAQIQYLAGDPKGTLETLAQCDRLNVESLPDYSPMRRLETLSLKSNLGLASETENDFLAHYPGQRPDLMTEGARPFAHSREKHLGARPWPARPDFVLFPEADEYRIGDGLFAGIPLELRLLGILEAAADYGVHRNLLLALLWPEHWMLHETLDARLSKLISRLREEHALDVTVDRECVFLSKNDRSRVAVDPFQKHPKVLEEILQRTGAQELHHKDDLVAPYGLGPTQALALIQSWMDRGWIERTGKARKVRYRITL